MKKIAFLGVILLASLNGVVVRADAITLNSSTIGNALEHVSTVNASNSLPMIYGGQDISRSQVASAEETIWSGQPKVVG